jgi:hypothetical protein
MPTICSRGSKTRGVERARAANDTFNPRRSEMGFAPRPYEIHSITIEIAGPIDEKKFAAYKKELRTLLAKVGGTKRTHIRRIALELKKK